MRNEVLWGNQSTCCATATMMIVQVDYYQLLITHVWHVCQANVKQSVSSQRQTKRDLLCLSPHIQVNWISGCPRDPDFVFLVHFGFDLWLPQRSQKCSGWFQGSLVAPEISKVFWLSQSTIVHILFNSHPGCPSKSFYYHVQNTEY